MKSQLIGKSSEDRFGATLTAGGCEFRVWAPLAEKVMLRFQRGPANRDLSMPRSGNGCFELHYPAQPGDRYFYLVDGSKPLPDPVSRFLPEGVHGPTEIVDPSQFRWSDIEWRGLALDDYVIYELHTGTFTPEGTFDAAIGKLPYLVKLGITAIELMPVAAFPGTRNWGYDGVSPYAVQASYGGPEGLRRLVNASHEAGLAVIMDVVYNHLGNEGNYLRLFGPYFTDRHQTPWGDAINYDQPGSEGVRKYVIENALYWAREFHMDGLRLDAVQTIHDDSSQHILAEIEEEVAALAVSQDRKISVIAETDENDPRFVRPRSAGGYGLDAVWSDDFHHAIHAFFTGEREGYYQDFGSPQQIVRALNEGFVFQGEPFRFWEGRRRGAQPQDMPLPAHVICTQNHDQVGNRAQGERLTALIPRGARTLAAALLLLAPETPLIFMGQEYDEKNPFQFFTDYGDPALQEAVAKGRRDEFKGFNFQDVPDPQGPETFIRSKLNWELAEGENAMLGWHVSLLQLRRKFVLTSARTCHAELSDGILHMQVPAEDPVVQVFARIQGNSPLPEHAHHWEQVLVEEADGYAVAIWVRPAKSH